MFKASIQQVRTYMKEGYQARGFEHGVLLGESGYAVRPFLLTPYPNPQDDAQERYNRAHEQTRSQIEKAFGRPKKRFHVLHSGVIILRIIYFNFKLRFKACNTI